jgi:hypothetical protein
MGKLAERLGDPARAGVYRVETTVAVEEAAALNGYALLRLRFDAEGGAQALADFAAVQRPDGRVALVSDFEQGFASDPARRDALLEALAAAAAEWRACGIRGFVVFFDPGYALPALAPLYNWHKSRSRQAVRTA